MSGEEARRLALEVLGRIERDGAYANLVLRSALDRSDLDGRDRAFVTDLVYGTTRMRRACDHLVDSFLHDDVQAEVRTVLRLGAYQLHWGGVPPHAAVSATVAVSPRKVRGLCNAVLRRVAEHQPDWPGPGVELSVPDWLLDRLVADLGSDDALGALAAMNRPARAVARDDGYHQDRASQMVAALAVEDLDPSGELVLDLCAAPGGKATAMAAAGASVVAADLRPSRLGLVGDNAERLGHDIALVAADGRFPPFRAGSFDRVLVDAPCSGLGVLRRRADARWRTGPADVEELADLQLDLLTAAAGLVRPGGLLFYSVCTLTSAETAGVDRRFREATGVRPGPALGQPWRPHGDDGAGGLLLPQDLDSEGMAIFRYRIDSA
ncbi:MAG: transcription antitermination factor NusB [Acidimicrobiales bacterium]|nr:transcription antitermination factor NusB [Acidimicrobiales bacterium]